MYGVIVQMLNKVEEYFRTLSAPELRIYRNNLKFHVLMVTAWALNGSSTLPALAIPHLDLTKITDEQIKAVMDWVIFVAFNAAGTEDKIAKQATFTDILKNQLACLHNCA